MCRLVVKHPVGNREIAGSNSGSFDITKQSEAEKMIEMISVMKAFLQKDEASN